MWEADQVHDRTIVANVQALQGRCIERLQQLRAALARLSGRGRPRILGAGSTMDEPSSRCVAARRGAAAESQKGRRPVSHRCTTLHS